MQVSMYQFPDIALGSGPTRSKANLVNGQKLLVRDIVELCDVVSSLPFGIQDKSYTISLPP